MNYSKLLSRILFTTFSLKVIDGFTIYLFSMSENIGIFVRLFLMVDITPIFQIFEGGYEFFLILFVPIILILGLPFLIFDMVSVKVALGLAFFCIFWMREIRMREKLSQNPEQEVLLSLETEERKVFKSNISRLSFVLAALIVPALLFSILSIGAFDSTQTMDYLLELIVTLSPAVILFMAVGLKLLTYSNLNLKNLRIAKLLFLSTPVTFPIIVFLFSLLSLGL